jgi:3-phosphoshikimate 1-carboxyvinyltransferase
VESLTVRKSVPLRGSCEVPGDKSISHRALILASLARGESRLFGLSRGGDVRNTARALRALGVEMGRWGEEPLAVTGAGRWREPEGVLNLGNSGTGLRLMAGALAAHPFFSVLTGDRSLRRRPMLRIVEPLRKMGARIDGRGGGDFAPLAIRGGKLRGISYRSPVASAQVKTALLLGGLFADGNTRITEPAPSRDHTERMLRHFGLALETEEGGVTLPGGQEWRGRDLSVPGDFSAAAFPLSAALIVPDSEVTVSNIGVNPTRAGFLDILLSMGADLTLTHRRREGQEPVADLTARTSRLRGIPVTPEMVSGAIDELPLLAAVALFAEGRTVITGAAELRVKESDRIRTTAVELGRLGGRVTELSDGLEIRGGGPLAAARCRSHGDHRVAMALAVSACAIPGETTIRDTSCIGTSFPGFREAMNTLGAPFS